jgi:hypothetical protein
MLDGQLDASDYRNIKLRIEPEIEKLVRLQGRASETNPEEKEIMEFGMYFLANMPELFAEADLEQKHQFVGSIFPEKLVFTENEVRTNISGGMLELLINTAKGFGGNKEDGIKKFIPSSCLVPRTGTLSNQMMEVLKKLCFYELHRIR